MADWCDLFKPWILERGQEYFECGQVVELTEDGPIVRAEVAGSQTYHVKIHRSEEQVIWMWCDCPYAESGENCKHMAAVLFELEEHFAQHCRTGQLDWQAALEQLTEEKIRKLLRSIAEGDGSLQNRIVRMVSGPGTEPSQWQSALEQIICDHSDYRGWMNYDRAYNCMVEIAEYLEESLPSLLIDGKILDAAKLVMLVYSVAFDQDMDDSDGGLSHVSNVCRVGLGQILSLADPQQERKIFYMLHEFLERSNWVYGSDDLETLILSLNWSQDLQEKNLEYLDDNLDSWRMSQRADLMVQMGATRAELIAWWEQHRKDHNAYRPLLQLYEEDDLTKAVELVREHRKQERNTDWQIIDYTKTLLRLLEKAKNKIEYETELRYLVLELKNQETKYVARLKQATQPEQWPIVFKTLLADAKYPSQRMALYHFEGMYPELFAELCQYPSLSRFHSYEEDLRHWNPERALNYYTELLKREMDAACDRKQYRQIIRYLSDMDSYPDGQKAAQQIAAFWYVYHKNRPAMKDELQKAGYPQK